MVMGPSRAMKVAVAMASANCIHKQGFELLRCCSCVYGIQKKENLWFRMAFIPPHHYKPHLKVFLGKDYLSMVT